MLWKPKEDGFTFRADLPKRPLTHRGILSALSSLFDLLGFVPPVVLQGKLLLQEQCQQKGDWDEPVTPLEAESYSLQLQFIDTQEKKTSITKNLRNKEHRTTLGFSSLDAPCTHAYS